MRKAIALAVVLSTAGLSYATLVTGLNTWQNQELTTIQAINFDISSDTALAMAEPNPYGTLSAKVRMPKSPEMQAQPEYNSIEPIQSPSIKPLTIAN